jgi:RNA polymerase sigma-70 factor (ECF subfamily)
MLVDPARVATAVTALVDGPCNEQKAFGHYPNMGRRAEFERLYEQHAPAVKAYALRRADPSVADDVVAEVFTVCWRRLQDVPSDPLPWLLGVARRVLSTQRRSASRGERLRERLASAEPGGPPADDPPEPSDKRHPDPASLAAELQRLKAADQELLLLIAWEGLSPSQAAQALGISPAAARVRLHRLRRRLTLALEPLPEGSGPCPEMGMEVPR